MKKSLSIICLLSIFLVTFVSNSFAEESLQASPLIGKFLLNKANWTPSMESQLLTALGGLPEDVRINVLGYTDDSGKDAFNQKLAQKRADLVANKARKIKPNAVVSSEGIIYNPGKEQKINYRMAKLMIYYEKEKLFANAEKAFGDINLSLVEIKNTQEEIDKKIVKFNNSQSFQALELSVIQLNDDLADQNQTIKNELAKNRLANEDNVVNLGLKFKEYLSSEEDKLFERFQKEALESLNEVKRTNDSMKQLLDSIKRVQKIQISGNKLSQEDNTELSEILIKVNERILVLEKLSKENSLFLDKKAKTWVTIFVLFQFLILFGTVILLLYTNKKRK